MATLAPDAFTGQFFDFFDRSVFRLEQLDVYAAVSEHERLDRWLAGEPVEPTWDRPWTLQLRAAIANGCRFGRVHVATEPLSDYVQFEMAVAYPPNLAAGEDIRILPRHQAAGLGLPRHDFWLFDDLRVGIMRYDAGGTWLNVDLTEDADVAAEHRRWRATAMAASISLHDYPIPRRTTL